MPFGLDTKSVVIGLVIGAVVVPRLVAAVASRKASAAS